MLVTVFFYGERNFRGGPNLLQVKQTCGGCFSAAPDSVRDVVVCSDSVSQVAKVLHILIFSPL